ncbi:hypothetical protein [Methanofollis fontis]|uniref:Big-1 domain-containing protein n=1 Tax=Methanofollis fontis TaxID=2052832 RepID=A0A483CQ92_9EURY|nr:hypothetical protein [Methanofollis fontis]TAJ45283.1 hypothetical protein CUJ86_00600 [Methanofollis fontis]
MKMHSVLAAFVLVLFFCQAATASDSPEVTISADPLWSVAGDGGSVSLHVLVADGGAGVNAAAVDLSCDPSCGTITPAHPVTNAHGTATATFHPSTVAGPVEITASAIWDGQDVPVTGSVVVHIDHDDPYAITLLEFPEGATVGSDVTITVGIEDCWGNPIDDALDVETVNLSVGSPGNAAAFVTDGGTGDAITLPLDSAGQAAATLRLDTTAGENIVFLDAPGTVADVYMTIEGVANGTPVSITSAYASASCPANGEDTVLIAYSLLDTYGNPCSGADVRIASSLGETATVATNRFGSALVRYGPKVTPVDVVLTATAVGNGSVTTSDTVSFTSTAPVNMALTASLLNMKSLDVDSSSTAAVTARITTEGGTPPDEEVEVTFSITDEERGGGTAPSLNLATVTTSGGVATATFIPGEFSSSDPSTGTCTLTATATLNGTPVTRSLDLAWRNYPSVSVSVSAEPETLVVNNTADVTISIRGDGWEFAPPPADVMMCISRTPTMLRGYPDPMVIAMNASMYFAGLMDEDVDSLGLVSYGEETPAGLMADLREMNSGNTKSVYNEIGYDPGGGSGAEAYITTHYTKSGTVRFDEEVTLDLPLSTSYGSFNDSVQCLIPYSSLSKGQGKHSGDELRLALYKSITEIVDNGSADDARAVVVLLDDFWNNGGGGKFGTLYGNPLGPDGTYEKEDYYIFPDDGRGNGHMWGSGGRWQNLANYASDNDVRIYVLLIDTHNGNVNGKIGRDLSTLADQTDGEYCYVENEDFESDLEGFLEDIKDDLRVASVFNTALDASLADVTVDGESVSSAGVLSYEYVEGVSTWITNTSATGDDLYSGTVDDTGDWADDRVLSFGIGTIEYNQVWTATVRLNFSSAGSIGLFTDENSVISLSDGEGNDYEQVLPPLSISVVDPDDVGAFNTTAFDVTYLTPTGNNETGSIEVEWGLAYEGANPESVTQHLSYQYSPDNIVWDNVWIPVPDIPAVYEGVDGVYSADFSTSGNNGWYKIRVRAREAIDGGAEAWRTADYLVLVNSGNKLVMRIL